MGIKIYEKEATQNPQKKKWKQKQNKQKLGFLGNDITHARTGQRTHEFSLRTSSACVCKLDHSYADPYPKNLINTKTKQKPNKIEKLKSSNLTC